jgi:hypothetical protein
VVSSCEHGNGRSGSMKDGEFIDQLSYYHLLMKNPVPWSLFPLTISNLPLITILKLVQRR